MVGQSHAKHRLHWYVRDAAFRLCLARFGAGSADSAPVALAPLAFAARFRV